MQFVCNKLDTSISMLKQRKQGYVKQAQFVCNKSDINAFILH